MILIYKEVEPGVLVKCDEAESLDDAIEKLKEKGRGTYYTISKFSVVRR